MKTLIAEWFLGLGEELDGLEVPREAIGRALWLRLRPATQVWQREMYGPFAVIQN